MITQKMPWADKEHMEIIQKVAYEQAHPTIPSYAHPVIQQILMGCFQQVPAARIYFDEIVQMLESIQS